MSDPKKNKVLFLDRDGTLNVDQLGGYVTKPEELDLIAGASKGLAHARSLGFKLAIITNQAGIAKGLYTRADLDLIHEKLGQLIAAELKVPSFHFDHIEVCPHQPIDKCDCRKPKPTMVVRAIEALDADPALCFYVGDKDVDLICANNSGVRPILVRTGYGTQTEEQIKSWEANLPFRIIDSLADLHRAITLKD